MNKISFFKFDLIYFICSKEKNMIEGSSRAMISIRDECLVDSGTTNTILKSKKYFSQLSPAETVLI
jgi:hypothetical protein